MKTGALLINIVVSGCGALFLTAGLSCSRTPLAGGGTEDVNAKMIAGVIVTSQGNPASEATVRLFPSGYNPVTDSLLSNSFIDTTDEKGAYRFNKLDSGTYSLLAVHNDDRTRLLIENIRAMEDGISPVEAPDTLREPGKIRIMLPDRIDTQTGYVYIPGTDIKSFIQGSVGFAEVDSVPAGTIIRICYGARNVTPYSIKDTLQVQSGDSVTFSNGPWAYSRKMYLNTTLAGANVRGNVYGFPVLVRLTKSVFDFSQAKSQGEDVRFLTSGNIPLHHEIERWDPTADIAVVWVLVDTILGNNGTQSITICWGNPHAAAVSNPAVVFDTANNFSGV